MGRPKDFSAEIANFCASREPNSPLFHPEDCKCERCRPFGGSGIVESDRAKEIGAKLERSALVSRGALICELMSGEADDSYTDRASRGIYNTSGLVWC